MKDKFPFTTVESQIEKLKSQHLTINDEETAKAALTLFGYSNIIKSYRESYMITLDSGEKIYRKGVSFEQIFSMFVFDKELRSTVMAAMLEFEESLKEATAQVLSESFGTDSDNYLRFRNFRDVKVRNEKFNLKNTLSEITKTLKHNNKNPILHYRNKYNTVPPWILFKSVYLGTMVNFIKFFKPKEMNMLIEKLYKDTEISTYKPKYLKALLLDTLFVLNDYRNLAAHGGRIYNYNYTKKLRCSGMVKNLSSLQGFSFLLRLLDKLYYEVPYQMLHKSLNNSITRHCSNFPEDADGLSKLLNINITHASYVFLNPKTNRIHTNRHCSGMLNSKRIELDKAKELGCKACMKCASHLA